jgi:prephenate dehydratase
MGDVAIFVIIGIFGTAAVGSVILIIMHGIMAKHSAQIVEAITSMPTPVAQGDTIIKYVGKPVEMKDMTQPSTAAKTIVAEWAAEQERYGITVDPLEIKDQKQMWQDFGEEFA